MGELREDPLIDKPRFDCYGNLYVKEIIEDPSLNTVVWLPDGTVKCAEFIEGGLFIDFLGREIKEAFDAAYSLQNIEWEYSTTINHLFEEFEEMQYSLQDIEWVHITIVEYNPEESLEMQYGLQDIEWQQV
jgi:hypothetical protein